VDKVYPTSADDETLIKNKINLEEYFKPHTNEQIMRILQGEDWATVMSGEKEEQASQSETEHVGEEEDIEIR
jgi:hypothetical protein